MKAVVVFHSVCGNSFLVARTFQNELKAMGWDASLFRVGDNDWVAKKDVPEKSRIILSEMLQVQEVAPKDLLEADLLILGSPTYFGNVTAEMKAFMDSTGGLWVQGKLVGKRLIAFASAGNPEGGGDLCLQAIHTYGKYMGMLSIPLPGSILPGENVPALGLIQYSNGKYADSLDEKILRMIHQYSEFISRKIFLVK